MRSLGWSKLAVFLFVLLFVSALGADAQRPPRDPGIFCGAWCDHDGSGWYCSFWGAPDDYCCFNYSPESCGESQTCEWCGSQDSLGEGGF